jgi:Tol biopolymer transport system component
MLDGTEFVPIPGTDAARGRPRISPDGRQVYFEAGITRGSPDSELRRVPIDGSAPPVTICPVGEDWNSTFIPMPNGDLLCMLEDGAGFVRVSPSGNISERMEIRAEGFEGRFDMNFLGREAVQADDAVLLGTTYFDESGWGKGIAIMNPETGDAKILLKDAGHAKFTPSGHLVFSRGDVLLAAPYDRGSKATRGDPRALFDGVRTFGRFVAGRFELSESGVLAFAPGGRIAEQRAMATVAEDGRIREWADSRKAYNWNWYPHASRDGKQAVMVATNARGVDEIWISSVDRPFFRRLISFEDADAGAPILSDDHQWIAYRLAANDEARDGLYVRRVEATDGGTRVAPLSAGRVGLPVSWLPDNSGFTYVIRQGANREVHLIRFAAGPDGAYEDVPLIADAFDNRGGHVSPDGRWITFTSDRSGRTQVYVAALHGTGIGTPTPITRTGAQARFQGMRAITYVDSFEIVKRVRITTSPSLQASTPERLFNMTERRIATLSPLSDGRFIAIMEGGEEFRVSSIDILLDWQGRIEDVFAN